MQHNDYVNAVKEYLEKYDEFSQYVKATRELHKERTEQDD